MASSDVSTPVSLTAHKYKHLHHGTGGDLTRTPGGTVAKVTFNDDEAERRERRLHNNLATVLSPGCHSSAKRGNKSGAESVTSSLTNTQLKEHYTSCIKLSTLNKINSKNAFGLHLIDHLMQLLTIQGEMTNFQMASSTLDASAKIYAGRVDSIYTDALKVLTGFGREGQNEATKQPEQDEDADGAKTTGKTKKAAGSGVNKVLEKNVKSLNINTFDLEYQVDPLFKKTAAAFDEGGVEGLLINHLHTQAGFTLSLDADEVPTHVDQPTATSIDLPSADILKLISVEQVRSRQLCSTFTGLFDESGWSLEQATSSVGKSSAQQSTDIGAEYSMLPCPPSAPDLTVCDDNDLDPAGPMGDCEPADDFADLTVLGSDSKIANFIPTALPIDKEGGGEGPLGALVLAEAIQQSEYSYFAPSVLAMWAGPKHWRIQPKTDNIDKENKNKRKRQAPVQFTIDFSLDPDGTQLSNGKASVQFSKLMMSRRSATTTTLPKNPGTTATLLYKLFNRPKWEVKRRRGNAAQVEDQLEGDWYDYSNLHDNANYCPQVDEGSDGELDAGGVVHFPDTQEIGEQFPPDSQPLSNLLSGEDLVPQPRKVQQIHIDYAKTAKRLDIKKLKGRMWELLNPMQTEPSEVGQPDKRDDGGVLSFSTMCGELPSTLSAEMKRNISVPIAFVCLLHLANEKCLDIQEAGEDLSDLHISCHPGDSH